MNTRSSTSTVTFRHPFVLPGNPEELPPGAYDVLIEEELLQALSFPAYHRTSTWLMIPTTGRQTGPDRVRVTTAHDLEAALDRDRALTETRSTGSIPE